MNSIEVLLYKKTMDEAEQQISQLKEELAAKTADQEIEAQDLNANRQRIEFLEKELSQKVEQNDRFQAEIETDQVKSLEEQQLAIDLL